MQVNLGQTAHEKFQLLEVKDRQDGFGDDIEESQKQLIKLRLHSTHHLILESGLHVLGEIISRHINIRTARHQLDCLLHSHRLFRHCEVEAQIFNLRRVHVQKLFQIAVYFLVYLFQVGKLTGPTAHMLIQSGDHVPCY